MRKSMLGMGTLLLMVGVALAAGGHNEAIPACSPSNAIAASLALTEGDFVRDYQAYFRDFRHVTKDVDITAFWRRLQPLRETYYAVVKPDMPDCALSLHVQSSIEAALSDALAIASVSELLTLDTRYDSYVDSLQATSQRLNMAIEDSQALFKELIEVAHS